jgi:hypothetical protein
MNDADHGQLVSFCERLGASRAQAERMAAQLLKRAEQHASERGISREAALARLLELVAQGRAGEVPKDFSPPPPQPPSPPTGSGE